MNEFLGFLKSPIGKIIIAIIIAIIVGYFAYVSYQKLIYNGNTKSSIEKGLIDKVAKDRISIIKQEDLNFINNLYPLYDILKWYDENDARQVDANQLDSYLTSLGIERERKSDFSYLVGKPVALLNYA